MRIEEAQKRAILLCLGGSHAYGTNTPDSDIDTRGIFIAPREYYLGLGSCEQVQDLVNDTTIYELRKFVRLALGANPNILELLWTDSYIKLTPLGQILVDNREAFLSKKVAYSFTGSAASQLHRIRQHRRYLMGEVPKKPDPADFGIQPQWQIGKDETGAIDSIAGNILDALEEDFYKKVYGVGEDGRLSFNREKAIDVILHQLVDSSAPEASFLASLPKEITAAFWKVKQYRKALATYDKYQEWQRNRNPKRKALEEKFALDTKHAYQLVRLVRQGFELLTEGVLRVRRPDAEELLAIKNGAWSYEKLVAYADEMEKKVQEAAETSKLPVKPDSKKIEKILIQMVQKQFYYDARLSLSKGDIRCI